jgi:Sulfotransferase domain
MKVIGAGLPRTATLTQKVALETLGLGPCYHMVDVLADLDLVEHWERAYDGNGRWDEIFACYHSTFDWPGGFFYRELMDVHPDAKVLLSVRDGEAWERSMRKTVWGVSNGESLMRHLSSAHTYVNPRWLRFIEMTRSLLWERRGTFADSHVEPGSLAAGMERWNEEVRRTVPPERLLVWDAHEGWEPLCRFLEVDVPSQPLPHVNDSKEFADRVIAASLGSLQEWWQREQAVSA